MIRALVDPATTERVIVIPSCPSLRILHLSSLCLLFFRDYYAALLRTHQSFIVPTQGMLLNYVQHVALGVVAQGWPLAVFNTQTDDSFRRPIIGLFKVGNYLPLKSLLISHLLMIYCQIGNKSI
jgi:hypothetical protein